MSKIAVFLFAAVALVSAGVLPEEPVAIVSQDQDVLPDGSFHTRFETGNGISYQEEGVLKNLGEESAVVSQGSSSYTAPDGTLVKLSWTADENGFQAQGDHLPVAPAAPEIPPAIARALKWIEEHPSKESQI